MPLLPQHCPDALFIAGALDHGGGLPQPSNPASRSASGPKKSWSRGDCTSLRMTWRGGVRVSRPKARPAKEFLALDLDHSGGALQEWGRRRPGFGIFTKGTFGEVVDAEFLDSGFGSNRASAHLSTGRGLTWSHPRSCSVP